MILIEKLFQLYHTDQTQEGVPFATFKQLLSRLNYDLSREDDLKDIYELSNIKEEIQGLCFHEAVVGLSIAYLLDMVKAEPPAKEAFAVPSRSHKDEEEHESAPPLRSSLPCVTIHEDSTASTEEEDDAAICQQNLFLAFNLIIEAYLLFDTEGRGIIKRDEMRNALNNNTNTEEEKGQKGVFSISRLQTKKASKKKNRQTAFCSYHEKSGAADEARWEELDWNADGSITFQEFVFAFQKWVWMESE